MGEEKEAINQDTKTVENYVAWTKLKARLHFYKDVSELYFSPREIWWASVGINIGREADGKNENFERPVLVIKVFSRDVLWVMPLSTKIKPDNKYYYPYQLDNENYSAILSQIKMVSSKRLLRKIGMMNKMDFNNICDKIIGYIKNETPLNEESFSEAEAISIITITQ